MAKQRVDHVEDVLFSLDFLVEFIKLNEDKRVSDELAVAVRLLDFPTLIVYQPKQKRSCHRPEYVFNRGKSCSFKMNLDSLYSQLSSNPLSAMVLDVKEETPKLLGTCFIPLAKVVDRIRQTVSGIGVSSHGERGTVTLRNLKGDKSGSMSLSYKLSAASLQPHVKGSIHLKNVSTDKQSAPPPHMVKVRTPAVDKPPLSTLDGTDTADDRLQNTNNQKTEQEQHSHTVKDENYTFSENVFCPPYLHFCNTGDNKLEGWDTNIPQEAETYKDSCSEDGSAHSPVRDVKVGRPAKSSKDSVVANVSVDALRQLPLLSALLAELSQLTVQNPHRPLSIHPNLAYMYHPASTEPAAVRVSAPRTAELPQDTKQQAFPSPRYHSTPVTSPNRVQKSHQKKEVFENKNTKSVKKKLVYRTTRTFNLRLKKNSAALNQRECVMLVQNSCKESFVKVKTASKKECVQQDVNVHTSLANLKVSAEEDRNSLPISETELCLPIPSGDVVPLQDNTDHHSDSNLSRSESEDEKSQSSRRSQRSPVKSSYSAWSEDQEEANYADDFNSLDPTDSCSPDLASSPERTRARVPASPTHPDNCDSESDEVLRRNALPVPKWADCSPHQTQGGIQAQTVLRAPRLSSDESDTVGSTHSKKTTTESIRGDGASFKDSDGSQDGQKRRLRKSSGRSTESVSSFHHLSEEEDELGTLDLRKKYQHISELVANKLPGYTM
ncbi:microtubule-associated protein 10 [Neosynchiropus ocellatus]